MKYMIRKGASIDESVGNSRGALRKVLHAAKVHDDPEFAHLFVKEEADEDETHDGG